MYTRLNLLLACLLITNLVSAQADRYQVFVEDMLVGAYAPHEEYSHNIETFATMRFTIAQYEDTTHFYSKQIHTEDTLGRLLSIDYLSAFDQDTVTYQVYFGEDTISLHSNGNVAIQPYEYVIGPYAIKELCRRNLDSIGKSMCYPQFIAELQQIREVKRTVVGEMIEAAEKRWLIEEEIIGIGKTNFKCNRDFDLIEMTAQSSFGQIKISRQVGYRPISIFDNNGHKNRSLNANVRFPDPLNIAKVSLQVSHDTTQYQIELPQTRDGDSLSLPGFLVNEPWLYVDTALITKADTLLSDSLSIPTKLEILKGYINKDGELYSATQFAALARSQRIPTKVVFGYVYDNGQWIERYWNEVWTGDIWSTIDLFKQKTNDALRYKPIDEYQFPNIASYLTQVDLLKDKISISCMRYNFQGRNYTINQADNQQDSYVEGKYTNHGLGLKFELPEDFEWLNASNQHFARFENSAGERLLLEQINVIDAFGMRELILESIARQTTIATEEITESSKNGFFTGSNHQFGAIAIPQGASFILLIIESANSKRVIDSLLKKNLKIDY